MFQHVGMKIILRKGIYGRINSSNVDLLLRLRQGAFFWPLLVEAQLRFDGIIMLDRVWPSLSYTAATEGVTIMGMYDPQLEDLSRGTF